jgi:hypothetical protein
LTRVSEILDLLQTDVYSIPADGLNSYQGQLQDISSLSSVGSEDGFTLTVFFASRTSRRLRENLFGSLGKFATVAAGSSVTIVIEEPPTT